MPATRRRPDVPPACAPPPDAAARRRVRANALNLTTPLGLGVARLGGARARRGPDGLWLAEGYRLRFPVAGAFTIGDVITTASTFEALADSAPRLLEHEARHAAQYARLGLGFLPLYAAAAAWSWARYGDHAVGNVFERRAGLVSGCYLAEGAPEPAPRAVYARLAALVRR